MRTALPFLEVRHHAIVLIVSLFLAFFVGIFVTRLVIEITPAGFENLLARGLEAILAHLGHYGCRIEFTIRIKGGDKADGNQVIDALFLGRHSDGCRVDIGGNDGMVVGHLAVVKHLFALGQLVECQHGSSQVGIGHHSLHDAGHLRIDVVAQISGIDTRIGGRLFLVQRLDGLEGIVGRHAKLLVALHLQARQVEQARRRLAAFLGLDRGHLKR